MFRVCELEDGRYIFDSHKKKFYKFPTKYSASLEIMKKPEIDTTNSYELECCTGSFYFIEFIKIYLAFKNEQPNNLKPTRLLRSIIDICKLSSMLKNTSRAVETIALLSSKAEDNGIHYIEFKHAEKCSIAKEYKGRAYKITISNPNKHPYEILYLIADPRSILKVLFNVGSGWFYPSNPHEYYQVNAKWFSIEEARDIPIEKILLAEEKEKIVEKETSSSTYKCPLDTKALEIVYQYLYFIFRDAFNYSNEADMLLNEEASMSRGQKRIFSFSQERRMPGNGRDSAKSQLSIAQSTPSVLNLARDTNAFPSSRIVIQDSIQNYLLDNILNFYKNMRPKEIKNSPADLSKWKTLFSTELLKMLDFVYANVKARFDALVRQGLRALGGMETVEGMQKSTSDSFLIYFRNHWKKLFMEDFVITDPINSSGVGSSTSSSSSSSSSGIINFPASAQNKSQRNNFFLKLKPLSKSKKEKKNILESMTKLEYKALNNIFRNYIIYSKIPQTFCKESYFMSLQNIFLDIWEISVFMLLQSPSLVFGPTQPTQNYSEQLHKGINEGLKIDEETPIIMLLPSIHKSATNLTPDEIDTASNIVLKAYVDTLN